jgi:Putative stress-responsive transcriptional regulator
MRKLYRSVTDNKLTGLCGGIGQYFGIDSTVVRLLFVVTALFSFGSTIVVYVLAALLVPKEPQPAFRFDQF